MRRKKMNKGLQKHKVREFFSSVGIASDVIDVEAEIDSELSLEENLKQMKKRVSKTQRIEGKHGKRKQKEIADEIDSEMLNFELDQARDFFQQRSERSQILDLKKRAKKLITENQILKNPKQLDKWYKHTNRYDIEGVDD